MPDERAPTPLKRRVARAALIVGALLAATIAAAPRLLRGRTAGALVERLLPPMRGRAHVGAVRWNYATLTAIVRGRPVPLELEDVRLDDPSGNEVLRVGRVVGRVELGRGGSGVVLRDLVLEHVSWRFVDDGTGGGVGFLQALSAPDVAPGRRQGSPSARAAIALSIVNARLTDLTAHLTFPGWALTLRSVDVGSASLCYVPGPRSEFTFEVRGAEARQGGEVRVGAGAKAWTLPFTKARLDRVATTKAAPDTVHLEASEIVRGDSQLAARGEFLGVYGASTPPAEGGVALEVVAKRAAEILSALARDHGIGSSVVVGGPAAGVTARLAGPYRALRLSLDLSDLTVSWLGRDLSPVALRLEAAPAVGRYHARDIRVGWPGVGMLTGAVAFDVQGGALSVHDVNVALARPPGTTAPRLVHLEKSARRRPRRSAGAAVPLQVGDLTFDGGEVRARRLNVPLLGGVIQVNGGLALRDTKKTRWLTTPQLDVSLAARAMSVEQVLGARFMRGTVSFTARIRGPVTALRCEVTFPAGAGLQLFEERLTLPRSVRFAVIDHATYVHVDLAGAGGTRVSVAGHIQPGWRADLDVKIKEFPLARLPGIAETGLALSGPIWGHLRLIGDLTAASLSGRLEIYPVTFQGRRAGIGRLSVTTEPTGALRVRGQLMEGLGLDGWLRSEGKAAQGEARLILDNFETDALGLDVPGGIGVGGVLSGELVARMGPGSPSGLQGRLSKVMLRLTPAGASGWRSAAALELRAEGPVGVSAQGSGRLSFGPAHFAGGAGDFVLELVGHGGTVEGSLRGMVALAPLAAFVSPWVDKPAGMLDVDLTATRAAQGAAFGIHGRAVVRAPISFRVGGQPIDVRIPGGRFRLEGDVVETSDLPLTFSAGSSPSLPVTRAMGSLRVDARLSGAGGGGSGAALRAQVAVHHAELSVPLLGPLPVAVNGGRFSIEGAPDDPSRMAISNVDVPLRGTATRLHTPAGTVDRASYDLRLRGVSRRTLTLLGDIDIVAAHVAADRLGAMAGRRLGEPATAKEVDLDNPRLDLRLRSRNGAVAVRIDHVPDVHLDVGLHLGGTVARPAVAGAVRPAGVYSTILLALQRLFR